MRVADDILMHYGTPHDGATAHSGRYPWGSGENPYQGYTNLYARYKQDLESGLTKEEIAKKYGLKSSREELDNLRNLSNKEALMNNILRASKYKDKGMSNVEIAKKMGVTEGSVRNWLKEDTKNKTLIMADLASVLVSKIDKENYLDVGLYTELEMGVPEGRKKAVLTFLKGKGYVVERLRLNQLTNTAQQTEFQILAPPGTTWQDVKNHPERIKQFTDKVDYGENGKPKIVKTERPVPVDPSRVGVRYAEEGGAKLDGVIELRRGVADLTMGDARYAQVRIAVGKDRYIKGMAVYSDNLPPGVDILVNSNKKKGVPLIDPDPNAKQVLKVQKDNPDNPFGALIKAGGQTRYLDANGKEQLGVVNKIREEGDWENYRKSLSSQMLSKQPKPLVDRQLNLAKAERYEEFDQIMSLTNPAIKRKLLGDFADECDSAAASLKAASLPRQTTKVLLPVPELKDNEIYAPTLRPGEKVVLIRYPHAGTFEIPELTVVNPNFKPGERTVGRKALDAVGINENVAGQLSGADFDGDTALVIPVNSRTKIKTAPAIKALQNFDTKAAYPGYDGMKKISEQNKQKEMGIISNLITDMTLRGVKNQDDLICAVKYSMVIIDAEKHGLNWKLAKKDCRIEQLKQKYRGENIDSGEGGGAATIVSRSQAKDYVNQRKQVSPARDWDPETGEVTYRETGAVNKKTGNPIQQQVKRMYRYKDANDLVSKFRSPIEISYANYANSMKSLANAARKEYLKVKDTQYDKKAAQEYAKEIETLEAKLMVAKKNRPRERQAQALATSEYRAILKDNGYEMDTKEKKKERDRCLANARAAVGSSKKDVEVQITDREWEAIQSGALRPSKVKAILDNTDSDKFKERALPRNKKGLSEAQIATIKAMYNGNWSLQQIADKYGVSPSTISKAIKG
jgi:transcriptional regulator with XRE-family HTH domain